MPTRPRLCLNVGFFQSAWYYHSDPSSALWFQKVTMSSTNKSKELFTRQTLIIQEMTFKFQFIGCSRNWHKIDFTLGGSRCITLFHSWLSLLIAFRSRRPDLSRPLYLIGDGRLYENSARDSTHRSRIVRQPAPPPPAPDTTWHKTTSNLVLTRFWHNCAGWHSCTHVSM